MAKAKSRNRRKEDRPAPAPASDRAPQPNPPRRNAPLLAAAIVLFVAWLLYLLTVAFLVWRGAS